MGELSDGINGPIRGKVGGLVYYTRRGKTFVRAAPKKRGKKRTVTEKNNTSSFARLQNWMHPIGEFVKYGFKNYGTSDVGYRSAISYALSNEAVQGAYPNQLVDPARIRVTGGPLPVSASATAVLEEGNIIRFTWDKGDVSKVDRDDQAMLLAYSARRSGAKDEPDAVVVFKLTGAFRKEGTDILSVEPSRHDQEFHLYLGFVDPDRAKQSHSLYVGTIFMPGLEQKELFEVIEANRGIKAAKLKEAETTVQDKTVDIARNLRNMGLTDADIAAATGLSLEVVGKLALE